MPKFINPYNFIPLGNGKQKSERDVRLMSGVITYSLLTKTPLFIPNTSNEKTFTIAFGDKPSERDKNEHKSYDFFSYKDLSNDGSDDKNRTYNNECFAPVIPGSEIRGMIRSNYEILTNSCLSVVDDEIVLSKRTNHVFKAGLLKKTDNGYELYKAEDCLWRTEGEYDTTDVGKYDVNNVKGKSHYTKKSYRQYVNVFKDGDKVYFNYESRGERIKPLAKKVSNKKTAESSQPGYIILGTDGPVINSKEEKHCAHIFKNTGKIVKSLSDSDMAMLDKVLAAYKNNESEKVDPADKKKNSKDKDSGTHWKSYDTYAKAWENFKAGNSETELFPVYYDYSIKAGNEEFLLFISPAAKTREIYSKKVSDLLGTYKTCSDKNDLCPSCSLFGTIGGNGKSTFAMSSRLRFSDLEVVTEKEKNEEYYDSIVTIPELASPKLNNMEFYMKKPAQDAVFWTYDYYIDKNGKAHALESAEINGRKFYWHNMNPKIESAKPINRNMTIRPLTKNIEFKGKLYFDRITEKELNSIIWLLNAGDDVKEIKDVRHGFKLGAAKPLGFGSVALHIVSVDLRNIKMTESSIDYAEDPYEYLMDELSSAGNTLFDDSVVKNFIEISDFEAVKNTTAISYPKPDRDPDAEGYVWFSNYNHKAYRYDKKTKKNINNNSPDQRTQEYYKYYMEPLKFKLIETNHPLNTGEQQPVSVDKISSMYEKGKDYSGKITGYNDKKTIAYVKLNDGGRTSVHYMDVKGKKVEKGSINTVLVKDSLITLTYKGKVVGKDNKEHDKWECRI